MAKSLPSAKQRAGERESLVDRLKAILARIESLTKETDLETQAHGTFSLFANVYGAESTQLRQLQESFKGEYAAGIGRIPHQLRVHNKNTLRGALQNLKSEIEAGLLGSLRAWYSGEVLGDFLGVAREALSQKTPNTGRVAAVLVAAAFEETLRRLAMDSLQISDRRRLDEIHKALKDGDILRGSEVSSAQSFLSFRNNALHADWEKVERPTTEAVLGFTDALLQKHFT